MEIAKTKQIILDLFFILNPPLHLSVLMKTMGYIRQLISDTSDFLKCQQKNVIIQ